MSIYAISGELGLQLAQLHGPTTLIDEAGRVLGTFQPSDIPLTKARAECPFTDEELKRRSSRGVDGAKPLEQILREHGLGQ